MKKWSFIFIPVLAVVHANAQNKTIKEVFQLLPPDKVYNLTPATRDSMLQGKTYYPASNDSNEIQAYNYGSSVYVTDYLYVSMSFETEQRGSGMVEIRSFKTMSGDDMVLVSKTGGVWQVAYKQQGLSAFIYGKDKKLIPYKKTLLPATNESIFMKQGVPDSVKKIIMDNSNMSYDLSNEKIMVSLDSDYVSGNKALRKWLKGDRIYFDWTNDHFVISKIEFRFPD